MGGCVKPEMFETFPPGSTLRACGYEGFVVLSRNWTEAQYPARALIVSEHDTDDDVFFILTGRGRAATYTNSGKEILLSELPPGESFGIFAAIDGQPRSTNVVAVEDSRIARMSASNFNKVLDNHTGVMRAFLVYFCDRIRTLSARVTDVTTMNAEQRLVSELIRLSRDRVTGDMAVIDPVPTQQELATLIFSQRESVGRDMSKLKEAGLIRRDGRAVVITSLRRLAQRLEDV